MRQTGRILLANMNIGTVVCMLTGIGGIVIGRIKNVLLLGSAASLH